MSKSSKLPAFQFYPGDWRKDPGVQALDFHDRGVWFEMLCLMHESERRGVLLLNGQAMPQEALARLLGLDNQILTNTLSKLLAYGVASREEETGAIMCRRMIKDEHLRQVRTLAGAKGGNPVCLTKKQPKGEQTPKQNPTPSSSSSSSEEEIQEGGDAGTKELPFDPPLPGDPFELEIYKRDPMVYEAEFIQLWNALPDVARYDRGALLDAHSRRLRERLADPDWLWRQAFARFPLNWQDKIPSVDWFLDRDSVLRILSGRYTNKPTGVANHGRGRRGPAYGNGPGQVFTADAELGPV